MKVNLEDIKQVAKLAKITLTQEEVKNFSHELSRVFEWVEQLERLCLQVHQQEPELACPMVDDVPECPIDTHILLSNAPKQRKEHCVVPNVLGDV
ncbi:MULTISPECIES: Asp-tRNA(Asn)/Glu-tRNA(Gln) amidotransferase subunit GatC [Holospora]|uniref:Glutamyl-tRNA(Gln) amidotransferase subunit C n=2 Tax=Holospora TaxID=44747 RepID=A0A061JG18_9PROT|nr:MULTISPECIES: Asp-tRNA(Asn)/Glu-tRNA(Gln) amidotransferase subunit GatC [Holospora]ETZ04791.1 aspartyl/glutamyl-tRNA(Asn/Gln) amidotransferase subunit C [Holospora undulata HU1]GAJ45703.1 aspartyl/glutamyl-tRNA(Asn/Gln) amidotransferase subunit C [Holospora elegans E1]